MEKEIIIASIIALIVGVIIGIFIESNSQSSENVNTISKNPFGFEVWNTSSIKEVTFNVKEIKFGVSVIDCTEYLVNNYETPSYWFVSKHKYQCILDGVIADPNVKDRLGNIEKAGSCRCEYN